MPQFIRPKCNKFCFLLISFIILVGNLNAYASDPLEELNRFLAEGDYYNAHQIIKKQFNTHFPNRPFDPYQGKHTIDDMEVLFHGYEELCPSISDLALLELDLFKGARERTLTEKEFEDYRKRIATSIANQKEFNTKDPSQLHALALAVDTLSMVNSKVYREVSSENDDQEGEEQNPWDNLSKNDYKPNNQDIKSQKDKNNSLKHLLVETEAKLTTPYMGVNYFETINASNWTKSPIGRAQFHEGTGEDYSYTVYTYGSHKIPLPIPAGYRPVLGKALTRHNPLNIRITEKYPEEFILTYSGGPVEKVTIRLEKMKLNQTLLRDPYFNARLKRHYALHSGIKKEHWPKDLLGFIEDLKRKGLSDHLEIAAEVERYIKTNFRYYTSDDLDEKEMADVAQKFNELKNRGEEDVVIFSKVKVIQCDGAAYLMAVLLRDFFEIPTRAVKGKTAVRRGDKIVVRKADPNHAWINVFDSNRGWFEFDPTPKKENKNKKDDEDKDDKKDHRPDQSIVDDGDRDNEVQDKGSQTEKEKESKESAEVEQTDTSGSNQRVEEDDSNVLNNEILSNLMDRQTLKDSPYYSIFIELINTRLTMALSFYGRPKSKLIELDLAVDFACNLTEDFPLPFKNVIEHLKTIRAKERSRLLRYDDYNDNHFVGSIRTDFSQQKYHEGFDKISSIISDLTLLKDYRKLTDSEANFLADLEALNDELLSRSDQDSKAYTIVRRFMGFLPGPVSRNLVRSQFGDHCDQLGHPQNQALAELITKKDKKVAFFMHLIGSKHLTEIELKRSFTPRYEKFYIGSITSRTQPRSTMVKTYNPLDLLRAQLPLVPHQEVHGRMLQGEILVRGHRRPVESKVFTRGKKKILNVILVDESVSMNEDRTYLLRTLVSTYLDMSKQAEIKDRLSTHEALVIPFSSDVDLNKMLHIKTRQDVEDYLSMTLRNTDIIGRGTNIQKALCFALQQIASQFAEKKSGKTMKGKNKLPDLRYANIWLITDGQSKINKGAIQQERDRIPEGVRVNLNISSIDQSLKEPLKSLATFSNEVSRSSLADVSSLIIDSTGVAFRQTEDLSKNLYDLEERAGRLSLAGVIPPKMAQNINMALFSTISFAKVEDGNTYDRALDLIIDFFIKKKNTKELKEQGVLYPLFNVVLNHIKGQSINVITYQTLLKIQKRINEGEF